MLKVWVDGGTRGSVVCLAIGNLRIVKRRKKRKGKGKLSNNELEYLALILALQYLKTNGMSEDEVEIYSDSKLVVNQVLGKWQTNERHLSTLMQKTLELFRPNYSLKWVRRDLNVAGRHLEKIGPSLRKQN